MKVLKSTCWILALVLCQLNIATAQSQVETDTVPPINETINVQFVNKLGYINEKIIKCFPRNTNGVIEVTSIEEGVINVRDSQGVLTSSETSFDEFIKIIEVPKGEYSLVISTGDKIVTRYFTKQ